MEADTPTDEGRPAPRASATRGGLMRLFTNVAYDAEKGGSTPRHELSANTAVLKLSELPPYVADALRSLDVDGDGTINVGELHVGAEKADRSLKKSQFFRKLFVVLFGLWLAQLASTFGVVFGTVNYAKESIVNSDARMLTKDGRSTVQTAAAMLAVPLTSQLSDDAFLELKTISLTSPTGAVMHLSVLGFLRMPGTYGTVTVITHIGRIVLDGQSLSYIDDSQAALFQAAGFAVNTATRRLLQVRQLQGIFNAVSAVTSLGTTAPDFIPPPSLPDSFIMFARRLTPCVPVTPPAGQPVPVFTGTYTAGMPLPRTGVDLCDLLAIDNSQLLATYNDDGSVDQRFIAMQYTMYRMGPTLLRVEYQHPLVPEWLYVEVLDSSVAASPVQFSYQVSAADKGIGLVPLQTSSVASLVGPVAYYNTTEVTQSDLVAEALSSPLDYLGNTTLAGEDVRIWALKLNEGKFVAYWYDSVETQEVRRIAFGDFGVLDVVSIGDLPGDADSNAYLFMQPDAHTVLLGEATGTQTTVMMPTKITLDPFAPFITLYKNSTARAPPPPPSPPMPPSPPSPPPPATPAAGRRLHESAAPIIGIPAHLAVSAFDEVAYAQMYNVTSLPGLGGARGLKQINNLGCSLTNKCPLKPAGLNGNYAGAVATLAVPGFPLGFAVGPVSRVPCMYEISTSVSPTQVLIPLPITVTGTLGVLLCSDLSSYESMYSSLSVAVGIPGITPTSPLSLLSWQIAAVGIAQVNEPQELQCTIDGTGDTGNLYTSPGDDKMLQYMTQRFRVRDARNHCACLRATTMRNGLGFTISGPDIPGLVLLSIPLVNVAVSPITPFLVFVKLRPTLTWAWYPFFCGMTRSDIDFVISLTLDLVFFKESINIFDPSFNFLSAYPWPSNGAADAYSAVQGPVGMEVPDWVSGSNAITQNLVDAVTMIAKKLENADVAWTAIVGASQALKDASSTYFASAAGQTNLALTRIFRPGRVYEYGCFNSYWTGGQCVANAPRFKVFGRKYGGQCIAWAPYVLKCGSTQRCIANCR